MAPRLGQAPQRASEKPPALELRPLRLSVPALLCGLGRAADHLSFRVLICEMGQQEACESGGACERLPLILLTSGSKALCGLSWLTLSSITKGPLPFPP